LFGLVVVDKPAGITSRDVVNCVQRIVEPLKVGHAGTLDPLATGVLVIAIGPATRLVEYVQRMPKTYRATFLLGRTSDTEDIEGQVRELDNPPRPSEEQVRAALPRFRGTIEQVPPAYSAVKVAGRRAYALARRGQAVELAARSVEIFALDLIAFAYPELKLLVSCGSGTYVRSLGRDLARALGTEAVMSALRREAIGPFTLAAAVDGDRLDLATIGANLLSPILAVSDLPRLDVTESEARRLALGQSIENRWNRSLTQAAAAAVRDELVAIVMSSGDNRLRAGKGFRSSQ
jgi:tRNA pseudouridine55 synthase